MHCQRGVSDPLPLWPQGAPDEKGSLGEEQDTTKPGDGLVQGKRVSRVTNVSQPTILDPKRIGVLGFSAGGHLAVNVSNDFDQRAYKPIDDADQVSCRPDFLMPIYPAYLVLKDTHLPSELKVSSIMRWCIWLVFVILPAAMQAQFDFSINNGTITITNYTGTGGVVVIPDSIDGYGSGCKRTRS